MSHTIDIIKKNTELLSQPLQEPGISLPHNDFPLPDLGKLHEFVELVKAVVFPGYFRRSGIHRDLLEYHIGINLEAMFALLRKEICCGMDFFNTHLNEEIGHTPDQLAGMFIDRLPEIKRKLYTDVSAVFDGDPAARSHSEVIFSYPGIQAMIHHRIAHELLLLGIPVVPRIIAEMAHSLTGIDIHPGATIGEYFSIDHGTGVVIGETCVIGDHVRLYQGVTLGAKSFTLDEQGLPMNVPRHPILEDHVIVYSNSTILGRITIGHHSVIGGNIWQTSSVPPYSKILQRKPVFSAFTDGLGI